jgi:ABC-2 type transport system permease protein
MSLEDLRAELLLGHFPGLHNFCDRHVHQIHFFPGGIQKVLNVFNLSGHYDNFTKGVFDVTGIVYFISVIAICLFLTMQSIQKRRWN